MSRPCVLVAHSAVIAVRTVRAVRAVRAVRTVRAVRINYGRARGAPRMGAREALPAYLTWRTHVVLSLSSTRSVPSWPNSMALTSGNYACIYMSDKNAFICH